MTSSDFTFYTSADYWQELLRQLAGVRRGDRVAMMVMSFDPAEPITALVMHELLAAAERGAEVRLSIDAYNFLFHPAAQAFGPTWWRAADQRRMPRALKARLDALAALNAKPSGHGTIINKPQRALTNPTGGRSHIKYTVINNRVFVGGCNLRHTTWLDLMVSWQDARLAGYLYNLITQLEAAPDIQAILGEADQRLQIDARTALLLDVGKKGQSLILAEALALIDSAEERLVMTCQYFPNSITMQRIAAARRRGVDVQVIYGHPSKQGLVGSAGQRLNMLRERLRVPPELFKRRLPKDAAGLHAKLIATEKGAVVGSHNYVRAGVTFGTAEIALLRHDAAFAQQALAALYRQLSL